MSSERPPTDAVEVACLIAGALEEKECKYAVGGAIAFGYWAEPRGTLDVDITLYTEPQSPDACLFVLKAIGCELEHDTSRSSLVEHGYCRVSYLGWQVDVFVPLSEFYSVAKGRRKSIPLLDQQVQIWDAETLCVFKMMFFRRKDLADVEQLLRSQGEELDAGWVDEQIEEIYGPRDPRVSTWREIVAEVKGE